jgi:hypothetical protein
MTREEARIIVFNKCKNLEGREAAGLVEALEELGLLKLDNSVAKRKELLVRADNYSGYIGYSPSDPKNLFITAMSRLISEMADEFRKDIK